MVIPPNKKTYILIRISMARITIQYLISFYLPFEKLFISGNNLLSHLLFMYILYSALLSDFNILFSHLFKMKSFSFYRKRNRLPDFCPSAHIPFSIRSASTQNLPR